MRTWSLDGLTKYYRQTLVFSSVVLPEINGIFNKRCENYAGKVRVANEVKDGTIAQVFVQVPHVFYRFTCASVVEGVDARFEFFVEKILPQHKESLMKQTLVYVANYFDYVRLRNYFKKEDVSFVQICEYSKEGKVARARDMFFHGDAHFLLYTERYHFFHRKRIKGIRHLVFFQPPTFPHFYYEMCNLMQVFVPTNTFDETLSTFFDISGSKHEQEDRKFLKHDRHRVILQIRHPSAVSHRNVGTSG